MSVMESQGRLERWRRRLENLTVSPLTRDYPESSLPESVRRPVEGFQHLKLFPDQLKSIREIQKVLPFCSSYAILVTAFIILVSRLTGDEDIAIGANSERSGEAFVLRVPVASEKPFAGFLAEVSKVSALGVFSAQFLVLIRFSFLKNPPPTQCQ